MLAGLEFLALAPSDASLVKAEQAAHGLSDRLLWGQLEQEAGKLRAQEEELRELIDWTLLATDSLTSLTRLAEVADGLSTVLQVTDNNLLEQIARDDLILIAAEGIRATDNAGGLLPHVVLVNEDDEQQARKALKGSKVVVRVHPRVAPGDWVYRAPE